MANTDPSTDVIATLTDQARTLIARSSIGDVVFQVVGFGLGRGGFDPSNFIQTTPIVTTSAELEDKVFPDSTPLSSSPFVAVETISNGAVAVYSCRVGASLAPDNSDYGLGELALYGEIVKSSVPAEVGEKFVFALSHFPVVCKTWRDTLLRRIVVSF